jgi:hypothetical protein
MAKPSVKTLGYFQSEDFANRFVQVETVTNVPGFFDRLYHQSDQTCVMSQYVLKSGGAPPHSTT